METNEENQILFSNPSQVISRFIINGILEGILCVGTFLETNTALKVENNKDKLDTQNQIVFFS